MNKNRIEGVAEQGERATNRETLVIKGKRRRSGGRAVKECVLTWGDLALCLKGATVSSRSEKSAEVVVAGGRVGRLNGGRRTKREGVFNTVPRWQASHQMSAQAGRSGVGRGEAPCGSGSDEARRPRHGSESQGQGCFWRR